MNEPTCDCHVVITVGGAEWILYPRRVTVAADEYRCQRTLYAEAQCCLSAVHKGACLVEFLDGLRGRHEVMGVVG